MKAARSNVVASTGSPRAGATAGARVSYLEVERRFPALRERIIFLIGDVLGREKQAFLERIGAPTLEKPCDLGEVRRLVHQVLADRAG
jgi:hypothetical protein